MKILKLLIFLFIVNPGWCQKNNQTNHIPDLDDNIRYGRLSNGFSYYIKPLENADQKIHMQLLVKAGARVQDSTQLGIPHAIEHLAFRSSENFPLGLPNQTDMLNKAEMEGIGRDYYAFSGFFSTDYTFIAKSENSKSLEIGLLWFRDIADGLKFKDSDINKERETLKQELEERTGSDLNEFISETKLYAYLFPCRLSMENYFEHLDNFRPEVLREYYGDWYRPDLMTMVVVGEVKDISEIEKKIKNIFDSLRKVKTPNKVKNCDSLYFNQPNKFITVTRKPQNLKDSLNKKVQINLFFRDGIDQNSSRLESRKRAVLWELLIKILNKRYEQIGQNYKNSFWVRGTNPKTNKELPASYLVRLNTEINKEKKALFKTIEVIQQVKEYGVTKKEFNEEKKFLKALISKNPVQSEDWMNKISQNSIHHTGLSSSQEKLFNNWLTNLSLNELNSSFKNLLAKEPEDIGIISPTEKLNYKEKEIRSWVNMAYKQIISPYSFPKIPSHLISDNKIANLRDPGMNFLGEGVSGAQEYLLENGMRIIFDTGRDRSLQGEKIRVHGYSNKGASCFPKKAIPSAINAPRIVKNSGVGELNKFELKRYLNSNVGPDFKMKTFVDYQNTGIEGLASKPDFKELLQLIYLHFTNPRKDVQAFQDWKKSEFELFMEMPSNLQHLDFNNAVDHFLSNGKSTFQMGTKHYLSTREAELDEAYRIYRKLFSSPGDFTFIITGDFDIETELPLINKYLGNIPSIQRSECITTDSHHPEFPEGPLIKEFENSPFYPRENVMYSLRYIKDANKEVDWEQKIKVEALGNLVEELAWSLRFKKGFSLYHIFAGGRYHEQSNRYDFYIKVDAPPDEVKAIQREAQNIFSLIRNEEVEKPIIDKVLNRLYSKYTKESMEMKSQHSKLVDHYRYGITWYDSGQILAYIKSLEPRHLQEVANSFFSNETQYEFIMAK